MKEYGGYMSFEEFHGREYHEDMLRFDSVRSGLAYLTEKREYRKFWIPYYLCDCIQIFLDRKGIHYERYHIGTDFCPVPRMRLCKDECLLLVNYFGQITNEEILKFRDTYGNIIVDNTQAFYQQPVPGVDTVYACRKFFGLPDGAYLSTDLDQNDLNDYAYDVSFQKMSYIMGRYELGANECYSGFVENDSMERGVPILQMSKLVRNILKGLDYDFIKTARTNNYLKLNKELEEINELNVKYLSGLFLYPLLITKGADVKKKLLEHKIYVPTLWPNVLTEVKPEEWEYKLANQLILLPIDHRYGEEDMQYILDILLQYI